MTLSSDNLLIKRHAFSYCRHSESFTMANLEMFYSGHNSAAARDPMVFNKVKLGD